MKHITMLVIALLFLSGCGAAPSPSLEVIEDQVERAELYQSQEAKKYTVKDDGESTPLRRIIDREAGVVCWWLTSSGNKGITCMPISETNLK